MRMLVDGVITQDNLQEEITRLHAFYSPKFPSELLDEEALFRDVMFKYGVFEGKAQFLDDNRDHIEWFLENRASISWDFWNRYRKYLEEDEKLPPSVVESINDATDEILRRLENPQRTGNWDRRGMVVGNVQSGKTGNYIGLIAKAVDAGYKVIVVMAGLNNDLRSQTQKRIDKGFIGRDTQKKQSYDQTSSRIGVGCFPSNKELHVTAVTSADARGDFKKSVFNSVTITPGGDPVIAVVKKNVTPLKNLYNWFNGINSSGKIDNIPLLVIDDEADNASINTKSVKRIGGYIPDVEQKEQDPTKINQYIRKILNCFSQSAYVGYTATPFANIFIYPGDENTAKSKYGEDLFPRSFIVNLHAPSNYIGPERVFGLYKDKTANIQATEPLPLVREINSDFEKFFPEKHKSDWFVPGLPESLQDAVCAFILSGAARRVRGQGNKHHSMLVHVTRYVDVQSQITTKIKEFVKSLRVLLEMRTGPHYEALISKLKSLWNNDFVKTTASVREMLPADTGLIEVTWENVESQLFDCISKIDVKSINGKAADGGLDYDLHVDGYSVIAVGGDKLSRGLTLEGLTVSYYLRVSKMYDTLLQMGRWFGYRNGYADLCRLYTTTKLKRFYEDIAVANEELRRELDDMAMLGATPENYGLKVRTHPEGMIITALNKMRNSETRTVTYSGTLVQVTHYYKHHHCNAENLAFVNTWLQSLGIPKTPSAETHNNYLWTNVTPAKIIEYLQTISIHPSCFSVSRNALCNYILSCNEDGELINWSVALVSSGIGDKFRIADLEIGLSWRYDPQFQEKENDVIRLRRSALRTQDDEDTDLTAKERKKALELTQELSKKNGKQAPLPNTPSPIALRMCRNKQNGLLMIYLFQSGAKDHKTVYEDIYVGHAISFPFSKNARSVEYAVDETYLRSEDDDE